MNFWGYLVAGAISVVSYFLNIFPLAQPNPLLQNAPTMVQEVITPGYLWIAPVIDLRWVGVFIGLFLLLEGIRALIAIWRWILSLIPAAS